MYLMADQDESDATNGIDDHLVEIRDVIPLSVLFLCPGGIRSSPKEKLSTSEKITERLERRSTGCGRQKSQQTI
jgi:hypothetical protein